MRLSIIVPVYKVEEYIERCIRSLENQNIPQSDFEIIVINDGSPDRSRDVVAELMKEFSNIVLIDQENRGVSFARNVGIERACGKYLLFIDPDDYVEANTFLAILTDADKHQSDVAYLTFHFLDVDGIVVSKVSNDHLKDRVFGGIETYFLSRAKGYPDPDRSWGILFRRGMINSYKLQYVEMVPYLEDGEFMSRVLCLAERCVFFTMPFYMRTTRPGSATNSNMFYTKKAIFGFIRAALNLKKFGAAGLNHTQRLFINHSVAKFTFLSIQACVSRRSFWHFPMVRERIYDDGLAKLNLDGCQSIYLDYGRVFNRSIGLFYIYCILESAISRSRLLLDSIMNDRLKEA